MTIDGRETRGSSPGTARRRSWLLWIFASAVALIFAATVVGVVATRGDDSASNASSLGTQQLGSIQQACAQWQDGSTGSSAPAAVWCDGMVGWMTGQVRSGQMTGSMMWSNPEQMLATCQRWMVSSQRADGSTPGTPGWCGQMVDWMTQHMGDWDQWDRGWMMNGPMMGG